MARHTLVNTAINPFHRRAHSMDVIMNKESYSAVVGMREVRTEARLSLTW